MLCIELKFAIDRTRCLDTSSYIVHGLDDYYFDIGLTNYEWDLWVQGKSTSEYQSNIVIGNEHIYPQLSSGGQ